MSTSTNNSNNKQIDIIERAYIVLNNSYSPYSNFKVGASILTSNNNIYTGCNIESCSYGATLCAEGAAIAAMVTNGEYNISEIAITSSKNNICYPCGICLQKILEFSNAHTKIHLCIKNNLEKTLLIDQLLPYSFNKDIIR